MQVPRNHFRKVRNQRELSMVSQTHTYTGIAIGLCSLELDTGVNFKAGARTALLFGHKYFIYTHLQHPALLQRSKQGARPSQLTDTRLGTSEAKGKAGVTVLCSFALGPSVGAASAQSVGPLLGAFRSSRSAVAFLVARAELAPHCLRRPVPAEPVTRILGSL